MTEAEALEILHPDTTRAKLAEIEYYAGFNETKALEAVNEACLIACKALEKQIAKKPEMQQNRYDDDCWECSSCGAFLGYEIDCREESYQMNYCPHCGQKISWEEIARCD